MNPLKKPWVFCLVILLLSPPIDLFLTRKLYDPSYLSHPFFSFIFHYGPWPAFFVAGAAGIGFLSSFLTFGKKNLRLPCFYFLAILAIGPGLFVHVVFKEYFGRPRPREMIEFGGNYSYQPIFLPKLFPIKPMKSFPSGHSSMGFYFFSFVFQGRRKGIKWMESFGFILAILLGGLIGFIRIAQGGHFFSDIFFSGCLMWFLAHFLDVLLFSKKKILV